MLKENYYCAWEEEELVVSSFNLCLAGSTPLISIQVRKEKINLLYC
jgi:hypothetical protein